MPMPNIQDSFSVHVSLSIGLLGLVYVALVDKEHKYFILQWPVFFAPFLTL